MSAAKKYDWAGWFARGRFTLLPGRDYSCSTASVIQQMRNAFLRWRQGQHLGLSIVRLERGFIALVLPFPRDQDARCWNQRPRRKRSRNALAL